MNPPPIHPRPANFPYEEVFYDDGDSAMMYGRYKDSLHDSLGLRWTTAAESELGYPNIFGKGMWMVVPSKLTLYLLRGIAANMNAERSNIRNEAIFDRALADLESQNEVG